MYACLHKTEKYYRTKHIKLVAILTTLILSLFVIKFPVSQNIHIEIHDNMTISDLHRLHLQITGYHFTFGGLKGYVSGTFISNTNVPPS